MKKGSEECANELRARLTHFYGQTDGSFRFPDSCEGDLLKMTARLLGLLPSAPPLVLYLVLTHHWFDEIKAGQKRIEYREMTHHWRRLIGDRMEKITHVRFARGYTNTTLVFPVDKIDTGPCPICPGWHGTYYRIHFSDSP